MRFNFRTAFRISLLLAVGISAVTDASIIHKSRLVKAVRRESVPEKTRLADGTLFEKYMEKGELPPLPIEDEEEADDLNDPRIGHLDKDGGIAVPVDSDGRVLKGFEYLLKPITIDLDLEEDDDSKRKPSEDSYQIPSVSQDLGGQKDYKPYPNNQDMRPKQEFLPGDQEVNGDEYDDVASEPKESLPNVPDLPKPDYTDSGESDEDLKGGDVDEQEPKGDRVNPVPPNVIINEVIIPSSNIELPISRDDVDEKSKSADEIEEETSIERDGDDGDKSVDIPKNRLVGDSDIDETKGLEGIEGDGDVEESGRDENDIDLSDAEVENLAKDIRDSVFNLYKTAEFDESDSKFESENTQDSDDESVDPNSINAQAEMPSEPETPKEQVSEAEDLDGVVLPEQSLTDDEIAKIAAESLKPVEPIAPAVVPPPRPPVRGGRIGSGVQPDSATQQNIFIQFFIVAMAMLLL
ncbi:unnamed protein product [Caenorhabditis brenneri]